jgi:hypothetical protein
MAVKIEDDSIVKVFHPVSSKFTLEELNRQVDGFVEPTKIGPIWLMYDEKGKDKGKEFNSVASLFFDVALYGTVLIIPPQELPADWDAMDEKDYNYRPEDVDSGVLLSLQTALAHHRVFGSEASDEHFERLSAKIIPQEEWTYRPPEKDEIDENTIDFYGQVYDYISAHPEMFQRNILLNEPGLLIKLEDSTDKSRMVKQMIDYYLSVEEYEKCAFLQKAIED